MKNIIKEIINFIFSLFPVENKITFESQRTLTDGCPLAIYRYMRENNIDNYKLIWLVNKTTDVSKLGNSDYAYYNTLKGYYHQATAKYWIKSQSIGTVIKKKKNQSYIQVWHGNGPLKKMGYDINNDKERPRLEHTKEWDYFVAHSKVDADVIASSTGYDGKFKILGAANMDYIQKNANNSKYKDKVLKELKIIDKTRKIILYAPTFRDFDLDKKIVDIPITKLSKLKNYYILVRLHPWVRNKVNPELFSYDNILNACDYPDIEDLLPITDILITDYSSVCSQFAILNRPIVFYPYDYKKYVELRGGFYIEYNNLPGPICYDETKLYQTISKIDEIFPEYKKKIIKFNKKFNKLADGKACERFVNTLLNGEFDKKNN